MTLAEVKAASQIIITTYGQISLPSVKQMNKGRKISLLHDISWNRIIYDEAHHVSHKNTNEYKGALVISSEIYWLVTGTPIQNNEKELYNLYSLFGLTNSKVYYDTGNNYIDTVKERVFYGTKAGVGLVLPALHEHVNHIEWETEREREFAWHIHSLLLFCHVPQKPPAAYIEAETENVNALRMKYLSRAQQVCAYPPMLNRAITHYEALLHRIQGEEALDEADVGVPLSKINAVLKTIMERKDNGCGKIVFCHYYDEIDAFAARLEPTLRVAKFDGRVPNSKRADILSQPVDVLLAQIKMCREGLNLQEHYSEVYFPSPHFNPATEQQAIARCWRMGQQKEVHVFRYLLGGTPPHPPSISGGLPSQPLTMDTFATQLHMKKQEFVNRMAAASAPLFV
jgi:SNF2 family DNA or RNA helicase